MVVFQILLEWLEQNLATSNLLSHYGCQKVQSFALKEVALILIIRLIQTFKSLAIPNPALLKGLQSKKTVNIPLQSLKVKI